MNQVKYTISSLIDRLNSELIKHGDIPVVAIDADTGWPFFIKENNVSIGTNKDGNRLEFAIWYSCEEDDE